MNKQRKVVITTTYNEMGIIIDTKAEEVAQPNLQPTCNNLATDCISRQAAIDALDKRFDSIPMNQTTEILLLRKDLRELPPEQPEQLGRKRGKWVKARGSWCTPGGDPVWECSECGKGVHVYGVEHGSYGSDVADGQWVSCPNCGAEMSEE